MPNGWKQKLKTDWNGWRFGSTSGATKTRGFECRIIIITIFDTSLWQLSFMYCWCVDADSCNCWRCSVLVVVSVDAICSVCIVELVTLCLCLLSQCQHLTWSIVRRPRVLHSTQHSYRSHTSRAVSCVVSCVTNVWRMTCWRAKLTRQGERCLNYSDRWCQLVHRHPVTDHSASWAGHVAAVAVSLHSDDDSTYAPMYSGGIDSWGLSGCSDLGWAQQNN